MGGGGLVHRMCICGLLATLDAYTPGVTILAVVTPGGALDFLQFSKFAPLHFRKHDWLTNQQRSLIEFVLAVVL